MEIVDAGKNNRLIADPSFLSATDGAISFTGDDSVVTIGPDCKANGINLSVGRNSVVTIGEGASLANVLIFASDRGCVEIGPGTALGAHVRLLLHEPGSISIGAGCLFSSRVDLTVSDMHSIVDLASGERINAAKNVFVGDSVWIGIDAMLLKGASIGPGSIIGARAVVTGEIPANCVAAGTPARVVRQGVYWRFELT